VICPYGDHGVLICRITYITYGVSGGSSDSKERLIFLELGLARKTTLSENHVWKGRSSNWLFERRDRLLFVCPLSSRISGTPTHGNRCEHFAEQGCTVYATSRRLETMDGFKHPVEKRVMDVTSDDDVKLVVNSILEEQGKIDIVVNNAGAIAIGLSSLLESLID